MHSSSTPPTASETVTPARGGRALAIAQVVRFVARALSAMVLARLLTPDDYGLFGMASAVYGLLYLVRDLGAGAAVQQAGFTNERFAALCRFGILGGIGIGLLCVASGPLAAFFFHEPRLPIVLAVLAIAFPCAGVGAPRIALLYREQRAGTAAAIDTTALVGSSIVGVAMAAAGAGVWSLAGLAVSGELITCVLAWRFCPWKAPPARSVSVPWRSVFTFGTEMSLSGVATYFMKTVDQIVVGRMAGSDVLGVYGRGVQATSIPMQFSVAPFTVWITAELSRLRPHPDAYRDFFKSALNGLAHLTLPLAALCVAVPELLVGLVFGSKWMAAVPVVRWLGLALAVQPWLFAPVWLLVSTGRSRRLAAVSVLGFAIVATAVVAVRHGTSSEIAAATALSTVATTLLSLPLALAPTAARVADAVRASWRPLAVHGGLGILLYLSQAFADGGLVVRLSLSVGTALCYLAAVSAACPSLRNEWRTHFLLTRG